MAVVTLTATRRGPDVVPVHGLGSVVRALTATVEVGSADSATSTYDFMDIPSNARILGTSSLYFDDLASSGSPTLDIGLFAIDANITDDDDALNDGIDCATAAGSASVVKDVANYGKQAWEFVNGQTADPGGSLRVKVSLKDADVNAGGSMTMQLNYVVD